MRPDNNGHKICHTVIGSLGILCIIGAGVLNWSSQSSLSESFAGLQRAVHDLGSKVGATGDSTKILADAAKTIDRLNSRVSILESDTGQRHLSPENLAKVSAALSFIGRDHTFEVTFRAGDDEAQAYAYDIQTAFISGGWRPVANGPIPFNTLPSPSGVALDIGVIKRDLPLANAIAQALIEGGVKVSRSPVTNYTGASSEDVEIYVGARQ